jgi:hypothetical protein
MARLDFYRPPSPSVLTVTAQSSPERGEAFDKLLGAMTADNAATVHALLTAAEGDGISPSEGEWKALLAKWGCLDGPGAMNSLAGDPGLAWKGPCLLSGWATANPGAAAQWVHEHDQPDSPSPWGGAARRELVLGWLQTDFEGPAHWLNEHQDDPSYREATAAFAGAATTRDPEGALVWAHSIDGPWRQWAVQSVAKQWMGREPETASAALQQAGYTPEAIKEMAATDAEHTDLLQSAGTGNQPEIYIGE